MGTQHAAHRDQSAVVRASCHAALKPICTAPTAERAELALNNCDTKWGQKCPMIARSWRNVTPFFKSPPEMRRVIYIPMIEAATSFNMRRMLAQ